LWNNRGAIKAARQKRAPTPWALRLDAETEPKALKLAVFPDSFEGGEKNERFSKTSVDTRASMLFKGTSLAGNIASPPSQGIKFSKL
jgi:hypothetical protein